MGHKHLDGKDLELWRLVPDCHEPANTATVVAVFAAVVLSLAVSAVVAVAATVVATDSCLESRKKQPNKYFYHEYF